MHTLKIVADENMPNVEALFSQYASVTLLNGRTIVPMDLAGADVLLVRSVTQVNQALLEGSQVRFVGSATIGTDHVDLDYLHSKAIQFAHAPGCNANSVVQYVLSALAFSGRLPALLDGSQQLAIVGVGNVGSKLVQVCENLNISYKAYDPPKAVLHPELLTWASWQEVLQSDVISLHVPLTHTGANKTYHLFDEDSLARLSKGMLLINSARGAVVDNQALIENIRSYRLEAIMDVWENEPELSTKLRDVCILATPHIAGYSKDGKEQGTMMIFEAFLRHFHLSKATSVMLANDKKSSCLDWNADLSFAENLSLTILKSYPIAEDSSQLAKLSQSSLKGDFDQLRKNYPKRLEFPHWTIKNISRAADIKRIKALGFKIAY